MLLQKEELEQKHLHLVQIVESEKTAKWQYTQQCEELTMEIKKLRAEVSTNVFSQSLTFKKKKNENENEKRMFCFFELQMLTHSFSVVCFEARMASNAEQQAEQFDRTYVQRWQRGGTQNKEGAKLLPWMAMPSSVEANCYWIHQFTTRREYEKTQ